MRVYSYVVVVRRRFRIRIGELMLDKFKSTLGWYECKVVSGPQGGKWVVEWDDNDQDDTLKEPHNLKKRSPGSTKPDESADSE